MNNRPNKASPPSQNGRPPVDWFGLITFLALIAILVAISAIVLNMISHIGGGGSP